MPSPACEPVLGRERPGHSAGFLLLSFAAFSTKVPVYTNTVWLLITGTCHVLLRGVID